MELSEWAARGDRVRLGGDEVFVVDSPSASADPVGPPLLVIHGFPTSSVDWSRVLPELSRHRRVVAFDLPGFGLSDKPDRHYGIGPSADATQALIEYLGLSEIDLLTHDMGDTIGGEILARCSAGVIDTSVRRRVVTNGSIYLEMANLTEGQHILWSAPDELLPEDFAPTAEMLASSLTDTLAPLVSRDDRLTGGPDRIVLAPPAQIRADMLTAAMSVAHDAGTRLLPRLIRYLDDRRDDEQRYTGAIETHPSPLGIVWGAEDPIAVVAMATRLAERAAAPLTELTGVGHYPMIEAPEAFANAVVEFLEAD